MTDDDKSDGEGRWLVMTKPDDGFGEVLRALDQTSDWKMRACAGRTMASFAADFVPDIMGQFDRHGMSRAVTASEKQAWRFGFEWKPGAVPRPLSELQSCEDTCEFPACFALGCVRKARRDSLI
jgi:hypothetical protein